MWAQDCRATGGEVLRAEMTSQDIGVVRAAKEGAKLPDQDFPQSVFLMRLASMYSFSSLAAVSDLQRVCNL